MTAIKAAAGNIADGAFPKAAKPKSPEWQIERKGKLLQQEHLL
jgi:hypothetical protein